MCVSSKRCEIIYLFSIKKTYENDFFCFLEEIYVTFVVVVNGILAQPSITRRPSLTNSRPDVDAATGTARIAAGRHFLCARWSRSNTGGSYLHGWYRSTGVLPAPTLKHCLITCSHVHSKSW